MAKQYKLPKSQELKKIGYTLNYNTLKEAQDYPERIAKINRAEIASIILPWLDGSTFDNPEDNIDVLKHLVTSEIIQRLTRISKGSIIKSDYFFVVNPQYKNDASKLKRAWIKRFRKASVDLQVAMYDPTLLDENQDEAIDLVLHNELLRYIILQLPEEEFDASYDKFSSINKQIKDARDKRHLYYNQGIISRGSFHEKRAELLLERKYELMFSSNETVEQRASRLYTKIKKHERPQNLLECTSLEEKQDVIRYYLKKQSSNVVRSKNTRSKNIHQDKRKKIVNYISKYPDKNNTQVANALGVNRATVRKYRV